MFINFAVCEIRTFCLINKILKQTIFYLFCTNENKLICFVVFLNFTAMVIFLCSLPETWDNDKIFNLQYFVWWILEVSISHTIFKINIETNFVTKTSILQFNNLIPREKVNNIFLHRHMSLISLTKRRQWLQCPAKFISKINFNKQLISQNYINF